MVYTLVFLNTGAPQGTKEIVQNNEPHKRVAGKDLVLVLPSKSVEKQPGTSELKCSYTQVTYLDGKVILEFFIQKCKR